MKKITAFILILCLCLTLCGCGTTSYHVKTVQTLVSQDYSLAFRDGDPLYFYVTAGLKIAAARGIVDELAIKWFGSKCISFESDATALDELGLPEPRTFIIGVDINSFPLAYMSNDTFWGYDIELASAVCEILGWELKAQSIEKENVYNELASGNIDCAWGGIALNEKELDNKLYVQYGPYMHNDIVIATNRSSTNMNKLNLRGKTLAVPSTPEAIEAIKSDPSLERKLKNVIRVVGGAAECFNYLYTGQCDAILTDTAAMLFYNSRS